MWRFYFPSSLGAFKKARSKREVKTQVAPLFFISTMFEGDGVEKGAIYPHERFYHLKRLVYHSQYCFHCYHRA